MPRIFISHHHTDAEALSELKSKLEPLGFSCFLAHEDIKPGKNDLKKIKKEIRKCDTFLYIGSEAADKSSFCQQEIGMAKGLKKEIITTMTKDCSPQGFTRNTQAITYQRIKNKSSNDEDFDNEFFNKILKALLKRFPPLPQEVTKHLKVLGVKGFSMKPEKNMIHLQPEKNRNDKLYQTLFQININKQYVMTAKIGYAGQPTGEHTSEKMPRFFTHLQWPFFSQIPGFDNSRDLPHQFAQTGVSHGGSDHSRDLPHQFAQTGVSHGGSDHSRDLPHQFAQTGVSHGGSDHSRDLPQIDSMGGDSQRGFDRSRDSLIGGQSMAAVLNFARLGNPSIGGQSMAAVLNFARLGNPLIGAQNMVAGLGFDNSLNLPQDKLESLRYLLNDVSLLPESDQVKVAREGVYKDSLFRRY